MIELKNISVTFAKGSSLENRALKEITLKISTGEFVTVIGSNGAGKSTLLQVLSGSIAPTTGHILLNGLDITKKTSISVQNILVTSFKIQDWAQSKHLPSQKI